MFRAASVLIVMALAGSPTAKLACDVWCQTESHSRGPADAACQGTHDGSGQTIQATTNTCASATALGPFLLGVAYRVLPTAAGPSVAAAISDSLLDLHHDDGACLLRGDPDPPPAHTITVLRL